MIIIKNALINTLKHYSITLNNRKKENKSDENLTDSELDCSFCLMSILSTHFSIPY